jgi:protein-tyrosine phosphatase
MPMPASYAVSDGLLAGAYPETAEAVSALEGEGVTVFVDLTHPSDPLEDYGHLLRSAHRLAHPIPDMGTPTAGQVMRILDDIDLVRAQDGTVYVHCWGGVGRTGTVVGCWLARHGLDGGDAIARVAELRAAIAGVRPSPETAGQIALVRGWRRRR